MLTDEVLDKMETFCAERLIELRQDPSDVVIELAEKFPDQHALTYAFVFSFVASVLENQDSTDLEGYGTVSCLAYKCAASLAVDAFEIEVLHGELASGRCLLTHWLATKIRQE